jgi:sialate O-acetylesterase
LSLSSIILFSCSDVQNISNDDWNNKKCAVALTYDDGLNVHLDKVIPALDSAGFKGTFYLTAYREGVYNRINDWRKAATGGHELGNHTLFHPCVAIGDDRDYSDWVIPEYDMNNYTLTRMVDEIKMANIFLKAIDGKVKRTIAYPCGDCFIKDSTYVPLIKSELAGGRGGSGNKHTGRLLFPWCWRRASNQYCIEQAQRAGPIFETE